MAKNDSIICLKADPTDPEDGDVTPEAIEQALAERRARRGRPVGSLSSNKTRVTLRLDRDALERLKATGPGWQTRINDAVRKAAGL